MGDGDHTKRDLENSISGKSAAHFFSRDPSIARFISGYGLTIRDFIMVSFVSDQGPLSVEQLARILSIEECDLQESVDALASAGLIVPGPASESTGSSPTIRLTSRGEVIASRIEKQL